MVELDVARLLRQFGQLQLALESASRSEAAAPQNLFLQFSLGAAVKRLEQ